MKFQNCILINFEQTHGRKDARTDKPKAICPFNFSKVRGIIKYLKEHEVLFRESGKKENC